MDGLRKIKKIITGIHATDGAGVKLVRVLGYHDVIDFDPFLMLDAFDSTNPSDYTKGFPWHPHRGIETITYLIQGDIEHGDSLGNKGTILNGDCQWMTAGSGIIHQEMPKASPRMLGVQLWLNLPAKDKMTQPKYRGIQRQTIPVVSDGDTKVHILSGNLKGTEGAVSGEYVKPIIFDVELKADCEWTFETDPTYHLFAYIIQGSGYFDPNTDQEILEKHAVLFESGSRFWVKAGNVGARFLLLAGEPLKEPVAWGGSIVMNTQEELAQALIELNQNTFIK
ncbi:MAG: pirin family protein [Bacillota bacterium]